MSRLSLKPGGEPGMWEVVLQAGENGIPFTYVCPDVPGKDLIAIRATIDDYLNDPNVVFPDVPVGEKSKTTRSLRWWLVTACLGLIPVFAISLVLSCDKQQSAPPSTGGVIDQLCMRPDIECSTSIRYVHPQKSGVVEQGDPVPQMECVAVDPQGNYHPEPCSKSEEQ